MLRKQTPPTIYFENFKKVIREVDVSGVKSFIQTAEKNHYDLNCHDEKTKYTLLHFAISRSTTQNENDMLFILKLLKNIGCDVNQHAIDSLHNTPIHTASRRALPQILIWLIQNGAAVDVKDLRGQKPIDYANKQFQCEKEHMNLGHKEKLMQIKNILSAAEKNRLAKNQVNNLCRFGIFVVTTVSVATLYAISTPEQRFNI